MRLRFIFASLLVLALALAQPNGTAQVPSTAPLIVRAVTVRNAVGSPVGGLSAENFVVTQDGVPQRVVMGQFQDLAPGPRQPAQPPSGQSIRPDLFSPLVYQDRRLLALYFDLPFMTASELARVQAAALDFVETRMAAPDIVAVIARDASGPFVLSDFSDDRAALGSVIRGLRPRPADSDARALVTAEDEPSARRIDSRRSDLLHTVEMFSSIAERKALLYFAGGRDREEDANQALALAVANSANRANVSIYPIGIDESDNLAGALARAEQATPSYYLVAWYSNITRNSAPGSFHHIEVSLRRASGALTYRSDYYYHWDSHRNLRGDKEKQLSDALFSGDPITDLTLDAEVSAARPIRDVYALTVTITVPPYELVRDRHLAEQTTFDFIAEVTQGGSTVKTLRDTVAIQSRDKDTNEYLQDPLRYHPTLELPAGVYTLRLVARDGQSGRIGTYLTTISVPR